MARLLASAPRVVGISYPDDGWVAACLHISGRIPVWACDEDSTAAEAHLERMGLPGLSTEVPQAYVDSDLRLQGSARFEVGALPPIEGALVTILICTFNRAEMLPRAIASALAQSWPAEVLVVNDGSTDSTAEVLAGIPGIRVVHQENTGKPGALNRGLVEARGEAILVLDDDDLLLPGALHVLAPALFEHPERSVVHGDTIFFDPETQEILDYIPSLRLPGSMSRTSVLLQTPAYTGAMLIRAESQREAGDYDARLVRGEDMDMFLRLSHVGEMVAVPYPTFLCGVHEGARGSAVDRVRIGTRDESKAFELKYLTPVFRERWEAMAPDADRGESHAWAAGLFERGLEQEALQEIHRWQGPYTSSEAWIRGHLGLESEVHQPLDALVVVDEGDPGALEETLFRHAAGRSVWVNLEVPRDPLGHVRLYWNGQYAARERLHRWIDHEGPVHFRLSAAPQWAPPPLNSLWILPDLPASDAIFAVAAVMGWAPPECSRQGIRVLRSPVVGVVWKIRGLLEKGRTPEAARCLPELMRLQPQWPGAWRITAQVFHELGRAELARPWEEKLAAFRAA
ncbi:MAG: glycosyltransferase [Myxococcota bacterium]|nr:glycosyltransferase [Myxococcota bacterium]